MIYSKQRQAIIEALSGCRTHPTAGELYSMLRVNWPNISLATIYRNLGQLADAKKIMRISVPDSPDRFDAVSDGHPHLLCSSCEQVIDLPLALVNRVTREAEQASGHSISGCDVLFYGVCKECLNALIN